MICASRSGKSRAAPHGSVAVAQGTVTVTLSPWTCYPSSGSLREHSTVQLCALSFSSSIMSAVRCVSSYFQNVLNLSLSSLLCRDRRLTKVRLLGLDCMQALNWVDNDQEFKDIDENKIEV